MKISCFLGAVWKWSSTLIWRRWLCLSNKKFTIVALWNYRCKDKDDYTSGLFIWGVWYKMTQFTTLLICKVVTLQTQKFWAFSTKSWVFLFENLNYFFCESNPSLSDYKIHYLNYKSDLITWLHVLFRVWADPGHSIHDITYLFLIQSFELNSQLHHIENAAINLQVW